MTSELTERRTGPRIPVEMWVEEKTERELYFQRSANLSVGGIYLDNTIPHPLGTFVNLEFTLPGDSHKVKVRGEIVNLGPEERSGMGVRFVELAPDMRERIERFIAASGAAPATTTPVP